MIVCSAPSGAGKTTVMNELFAKDKHLVRSISWTTRKPRAGERHGKDYFFVSRKKFLEARKKNEFLEWAKVFREYYGTPKSRVTRRLAQGKDVVLVIDTRGAHKVRHCKPSVHIFLKPPSLEALRRRLVGRNSESQEEMEARFKEARYEMNRATHYDYCVVNHTVSQTVREMEEILEKERQKGRKS
ncbi:MAG: guanylate kinase [Candidatus Omnitrophica bacterium]|nr:guanylate kinase [Candidatus Omnitrophota bacterium]